MALYIFFLNLNNKNFNVNMNFIRDENGKTFVIYRNDKKSIETNELI